MIDHDLPVLAAGRRRQGDAVNRRQLLAQLVDAVIVELLLVEVSELRLICSTGTLEALNCTTIGGWMPGGISARIELVAETICAMARSRFTSGWK